MDKDLKTVQSSTDTGADTTQLSLTDPLYRKQQEDVAKMRASLLLCNTDISLTKQALQNISVLRVYHQVARIIKYLDLMDKLEEKLYDSIEYAIDNADVKSSATWIQLLGIQERLQKNMIESHKLLQPYLNVEEFKIVEMIPASDDQNRTTDMLLSAESRENIRNKAQAVLAELGDGNGG